MPPPPPRDVCEPGQAAPGDAICQFFIFFFFFFILILFFNKCCIDESELAFRTRHADPTAPIRSERHSALSKCSIEFSPHGNDGLFPSLLPDLSCPPSPCPWFLFWIWGSVLFSQCYCTQYSASLGKVAGPAAAGASAQIPQPCDQSS